MVKKKYSPANPALYVAIAMTILVGFSCCKSNKDDGNPINSEVNAWVLDSMRYWYYWNNHIPANPPLNLLQNPREYFNSLLKRPEDRFSIIANAKDLEGQLSGVIKTSGLVYSFFQINSTRIGMTVRLVHKGSPADQAGIKRGDIFLGINGEDWKLSGDRVANAAPLQGNDPFTIKKAIINGNTLSPGADIRLTPVENFQERAIHLDTVLTTQNGTKVGYMFYNRFLGNQAQALVDAFRRLKAQNVSELVVDLRYNGGGGINIAALFSAMTHKSFNMSSPFIFYEFNSRLGVAPLTYAHLMCSDGDPGCISTNTNVINSANLGLDRVFILATSGSASASELLINNLRPFMGSTNVIHIGSTTVGKDEGSITFTNNDPKFVGENDWAILPIILKYKNAAGEGDFPDGLIPQHVVTETVPYYPLGSVEDPLISKALGLIDPSMQPLLNRQMRVGTEGQLPQMQELQEVNKALSTPLPLDVTESLRSLGKL